MSYNSINNMKILYPNSGIGVSQARDLDIINKNILSLNREYPDFFPFINIYDFSILMFLSVFKERNDNKKIEDYPLFVRALKKMQAVSVQEGYLQREELKVLFPEDQDELLIDIFILVGKLSFEEYWGESIAIRAAASSTLSEKVPLPGKGSSFLSEPQAEEKYQEYYKKLIEFYTKVHNGFCLQEYSGVISREEGMGLLSTATERITDFIYPTLGVSTSAKGGWGAQMDLLKDDLKDSIQMSKAAFYEKIVVGYKGADEFDVTLCASRALLQVAFNVCFVPLISCSKRHWVSLFSEGSKLSSQDKNKQLLRTALIDSFKQLNKSEIPRFFFDLSFEDFGTALFLDTVKKYWDSIVSNYPYHSFIYLYSVFIGAIQGGASLPGTVATIFPEAQSLDFQLRINALEIWSKVFLENKLTSKNFDCNDSLLSKKAFDFFFLVPLKTDYFEQDSIDYVTGLSAFYKEKWIAYVLGMKNGFNLKRFKLLRYANSNENPLVKPSDIWGWDNPSFQQLNESMDRVVFSKIEEMVVFFNKNYQSSNVDFLELLKKITSQMCCLSKDLNKLYSELNANRFIFTYQANQSNCSSSILIVLKNLMRNCESIIETVSGPIHYFHLINSFEGIVKNNSLKVSSTERLLRSNLNALIQDEVPYFFFPLNLKDFATLLLVHLFQNKVDNQECYSKFMDILVLFSGENKNDLNLIKEDLKEVFPELKGSYALKTLALIGKLLQERDLRQTSAFSFIEEHLRPVFVVSPLEYFKYYQNLTTCGLTDPLYQKVVSRLFQEHRRVLPLEEGGPSWGKMRPLVAETPEVFELYRDKIAEAMEAFQGAVPSFFFELTVADFIYLALFHSFKLLNTPNKKFEYTAFERLLEMTFCSKPGQKITHAVLKQEFSEKAVLAAYAPLIPFSDVLAARYEGNAKVVGGLITQKAGLFLENQEGLNQGALSYKEHEEYWVELILFHAEGSIASIRTGIKSFEQDLFRIEGLLPKKAVSRGKSGKKSKKKQGKKKQGKKKQGKPLAEVNLLEEALDRELSLKREIFNSKDGWEQKIDRLVEAGDSSGQEVSKLLDDLIAKGQSMHNSYSLASSSSKEIQEDFAQSIERVRRWKMYIGSLKKALSQELLQVSCFAWQLFKEPASSQEKLRVEEISISSPQLSPLPPPMSDAPILLDPKKVWQSNIRVTFEKLLNGIVRQEKGGEVKELSSNAKLGYQHAAYHLKGLEEGLTAYTDSALEGDFSLATTLVSSITFHLHQVFESLATARPSRKGDFQNARKSHRLDRFYNNTAWLSQINFGNLWVRYPNVYDGLFAQTGDGGEKWRGFLLLEQEPETLERHNSLVSLLQDAIPFLGEVCGVKEQIAGFAWDPPLPPPENRTFKGKQHPYIENLKTGVALARKAALGITEDPEGEIAYSDMEVAYLDTVTHLSRIQEHLELMKLYPDKLHTFHTNGVILHMQFLLEQYYIALHLHKKGELLDSTHHKLEVLESKLTEWLPPDISEMSKHLSIGTSTSYPALRVTKMDQCLGREWLEAGYHRSSGRLDQGKEFDLKDVEDFTWKFLKLFREVLLLNK